jgi:transforming growth factor-beta-induced protein
VAGLSSAELADVLTYHVVSGANVLSSDLTDGMTVTTLNGTFTVNISGSAVTLTDDSGATVNVIATDVQGTNGVIHAIDKVLLK